MSVPTCLKNPKVRYELLQIRGVVLERDFVVAVSLRAAFFLDGIGNLSFGKRSQLFGVLVLVLEAGIHFGPVALASFRFVRRAGCPHPLS